MRADYRPRAHQNLAKVCYSELPPAPSVLVTRGGSAVALVGRATPLRGFPNVSAFVRKFTVLSGAFALAAARKLAGRAVTTRYSAPAFEGPLPA